MKLSKLDIFPIVAIFIVSCLFTADLFLQQGVPASFDSFAHIATIAQFSRILQTENFPVTWTDRFANYGLPIPIVAHQVTSYLGAFLTFFTHNPVVSFNDVTLIGVFLSGLFYYLFLRIYFEYEVSFLGSFLFIFTAYRIINIYIRGAMPEAFSSAYVPLISIGIYHLIKRKQIWAFFLLIIAFTLLTLTHPMMFVVYSVLYIPYLSYLTLESHGRLVISRAYLVSQWRVIILFLAAVGLGVGLASYYIIPLSTEIRYFYYGQIRDHITSDSFLRLGNFFDPRWYYFTEADILTRGQVIQAGLVEMILFTVGLCSFLWKLIKKQLAKNFTLMDFGVVSGAISIVFMIQISEPLYRHIHILNNVQFPWRMLSAFICIPPILIASLFRRAPKYLLLVMMIIIAVITFPQLYGKNYVLTSNQMYYFNPINAHSVLMNTIWSGRSEDYPVESTKGKIISGQGKIVSQKINNSSRDYVVDAKSGIRMVDYTFYFPGWKALVDNVEVPIQFQNPEQRGVITYAVPSGLHHIHLEFTATKVRLFSGRLSLFFGLLIIILLLKRNQLSHFLKTPTRVEMKKRV